MDCIECDSWVQSVLYAFQGWLANSLKSEQKLDFSFLAIVDIVKLTSVLLLIGKAENELAIQAFGGDPVCPEKNGIGTLKLDGKVSRKKVRLCNPNYIVRSCL